MINNSFVKIFICTIATLIFTHQAYSAEQVNVAGSELQLNGIAVQSELRQEWFLNSLYLTNKTDDSQSIAQDPSIKRMELKVLADSLSGRRLKRFWIEKIRNNNDGSAVLSQAKDVRAFASILGQNLVASDILHIDFSPNAGTIVSINGSEVARFTPSLFELVVNTWVGERPPSKEFKSSILGDQSPAVYSSLIAKSISIEPTAARVAQFDQAVQKAIEDARKAEEAEALAAQLELEAEQQALREAEQAKELAQQQADAESQRQQDLAAQRAREAAEELALQQPVVEEVPAGPTEEELNTIRARYTRSINNHYVPFFKYPQRKILRRHGANIFRKPRKGKSHGRAIVTLELDKSGDLVGGSIAKSSGEKILDNAISKALFDAEPYPAMPAELPEETFKINLTIDIPAPQQ